MYNNLAINYIISIEIASLYTCRHLLHYDCFILHDMQAVFALHFPQFKYIVVNGRIRGKIYVLLQTQVWLSYKKKKNHTSYKYCLRWPFRSSDENLTKILKNHPYTPKAFKLSFIKPQQSKTIWQLEKLENYYSPGRHRRESRSIFPWPAHSFTGNTQKKV